MLKMRALPHAVRAKWRESFDDGLLLLAHSTLSCFFPWIIITHILDLCSIFFIFKDNFYTNFSIKNYAKQLFLFFSVNYSENSYIFLWFVSKINISTSKKVFTPDRYYFSRSFLVLQIVICMTLLKIISPAKLLNRAKKKEPAEKLNRTILCGQHKKDFL